MKHHYISPHARIDPSVEIGPYAIIEDRVVINANTKIGAFSIIRNGSRIGNGNNIHAGVQIGVEPQDYHFQGESSCCLIGNNNIIREYTTISRATGKDKKTIIGNGNFIMTYVHIAHNVRIGSNTVISSGSQIGGYALIDDYANIGGLTGVHQFCRLGKYTMLGAKSYLNKDLSPYLLARGNRARVFGINVRGLERNKFTGQEIDNIKNLYRIIFQTDKGLKTCLEELTAKKPKSTHLEEIRAFINSSERGVLLRSKNPT